MKINGTRSYLSHTFVSKCLVVKAAKFAAAGETVNSVAEMFL